jgi:hypothetical protein
MRSFRLVRLARPRVALSSLLAAIAAVGCSGVPIPEDMTTPRLPEPADPNGADAGAAPDTLGATAPGADETGAADWPTCGAPPYQEVRLGLRDVMSTAGESRGLPGATITLKHCPDSRFTTGPDGRATIQVSRGAETWIRFEAEGYVPWLLGEVAFGDNPTSLPIVATLVPARLAPTVVPPFRADAALIYLQVQMGRATAPAACRSTSGVELAVKDHPEAMVLYRGSGSNAGYARASATGDEGIALVVGLSAALDSVEITAAKEGCWYQLAYGDANAPALLPIVRTPVQTGAITHQVVNPLR